MIHCTCSYLLYKAAPNIPELEKQNKLFIKVLGQDAHGLMVGHAIVPISQTRELYARLWALEPGWRQVQNHEMGTFK